MTSTKVKPAAKADPFETALKANPTERQALEAASTKEELAKVDAFVHRQKPVKHEKRSYKLRNRIEIMFGRLKDWRRVATQYDRCPKAFLSAVALAAVVMVWL